MPADQTQTDLASYLKELVDQAEKARAKTWDKAAYMAYQFFRGNHYVEWDEARGSLVVQDKVPSYRVRLVDNRISPITRAIAARITDPKYAIEVLPNSADKSQHEAARIIQRYIEYLHEKQDLPRKLEDLAITVVLYGLGYLEVTWDAKRKCVQIETVDPFSVYVDPRATSLEDARFVYKEKARLIEDLYANPNYENLENVRADDAEPSSTEKKRIELQSKGTPMVEPKKPGQRKDRAGRVTLREFQIRERTEGGEEQIRLVVTAGKDISVIIRNEVTPYKHGRFTLVDYHNIRIPGEYYSMGDVEQLIPLQKELNRSISQLVENKNLMSRPKWLVPEGSGIPDSSLTSEPGEIIKHNPGMAPTPVVPVPLPAYVENHIERVIRQMEDISMLHDVSFGRTPSGVKSGVAIQYLQESDNAGVRPKQRNFEAGLTTVGELVVATLQQFLKGTTEFRASNENGPEYFQFSTAQIRGQWDIRCSTGSSLDFTKTGQRARLERLFELGAIDTKAFLKNYEFPNAEQSAKDAIEEAALKESLARPEAPAAPGEKTSSGSGKPGTPEDQAELAEIENEMLLEGEIPSADPADDDEIHLLVHSSFAEQEGLPEDVLAAITTHIEEHKAYLTGESPEGAQASGVPFPEQGLPLEEAA